MGKRPKVVVSVPVRDVSQVARISALKDRRADFVELRLDYLRSPNQLDASLLQYILPYRDKVLITVRDPLEGGELPVDEETKSRFLKAASEAGIAYDAELSFLKRRKDVPPGLVVSKHCVEALPSLADLREEFKPFDGHVRKLAVKPVGSYRSLLVSFLDDFPGSAVMPLGGDWRERIAFSLLGSGLLYVHSGEATAPGQVSLEKAWALLSQLDWERPSFSLRPRRQFWQHA
ncbi:type I 3-dehydroquinate dehydratase [Tardisphaera miroshnichenkoae]